MGLVTLEKVLLRCKSLSWEVDKERGGRSQGTIPA